MDSQELARAFNEDEAVWQCFENRRRLRLRLGIELLLPTEVLDEIDWIEAERECRKLWCVGEEFPTHRPHTEVPSFM
jgi:hypothetical protein